MKVREAIEQSVTLLKQAGIEEHLIESEYLVAAAIQKPRLDMARSLDETITPAAIAKWESGVQQRLRRRPLAYILGEQPFYGLPIQVNESVLIPRPETELLVELAEKYLSGTSKMIIVDVGTGSGNIALSLATEAKSRHVIGIDKFRDALNTASANGVTTKRHVEWIQGDLLTPILERQLSITMVIANLPYVRHADIPNLDPELQWEPTMALDGGVDGLDLIRQLLPQAEKCLTPGGWMLLETGFDQHPAIIQMLSESRAWTHVESHPDLAGLPRMILAQRGADTWTS